MNVSVSIDINVYFLGFFPNHFTPLGVPESKTKCRKYPMTNEIPYWNFKAKNGSENKIMANTVWVNVLCFHINHNGNILPIGAFL